jgi:hypothetical protein
VAAAPSLDASRQSRLRVTEKGWEGMREKRSRGNGGDEVKEREGKET